MQNYLCLHYTMLLINFHIQTQGENAVSRSTVNLAVRILLTKITKIRKYNKGKIIRVNVKRQGINKWSNYWSCSTDFQREKSKFKIKFKDVNKYNNSNHITFSVFFVHYKWEEVEISHVPSWYNREKLPYLKSTQLVFLDESHIQKFIGIPTRIKFNKHNLRFPRYEEGNIDLKSGKYDTKNKPKNETFK